MRRSAAVAAAVKSEEEEAKVHFCDDVPAIKWQRASDLAVVCGGAARRGAVGVKSLYRCRAVQQDTIDCEHGLRTPREEIAFNARPKIQSHYQISRYG